MLIRYYEINNCSVNSFIDNNTGENKHFVYAPNGTPIEILQRYKFWRDESSGYFYKRLSNEEVAELYQNMSPDKQWSVVGKGKFVDEKDRQISKKLCWISAAMLVIPEITFFILLVVSSVTTFGAEEDSQIITSISSIIGLLLSICPLVGIVTLVVARFKDPKSKFAKVLTIIYIVLTIISILAVIAIGIACGLGMAACLNDLRNCS